MKKLFSFTLFLLLMIPLVFAQDEGAVESPKKVEKKSNIEFDYRIISTIRSYYKEQTDYVSPLDSAISQDRSGANNRSKQKNRSQGFIGLLTTFGKEEPKLYGYFELQIEVDDPDNETTQKQNNNSKTDDYDGKRKTSITNREFWFYYFPVKALGLKIGTQTVTATSSATMYWYEGDADIDYSIYAASSLFGVPGASVTLNLSKEFQIGVGSFEGLSDGAKLTFGATKEGSATLAQWISFKNDTIDLAIARQQTDAGPERNKIEGNPEINDRYARQHRHYVDNAKLMIKLGGFKPYISYQRYTGDKASLYTTSSRLSSSLNGSTAATEVTDTSAQGACQCTSVSYSLTDAKNYLTNSGILEDRKSGTTEIYSTGLVFENEDFIIAADYSDLRTSKIGNNGWNPAIVGVDNTLMTNIGFKIADGVQINFFRHEMRTNDRVKNRITELEAKSAAAGSQVGTVFAANGGTSNLAVASAAAKAKYKEAIGYQGSANMLKQLNWKNHHSTGIGFLFTFK